jgi:NAD(P)-dependent dehydrogenase (short-subunit alcohol dehydrogenase family)
MGNKLEGKIAVITGATSGIGLATAKRFVSEGAYVFITGLYQKEVDVAVSDIGKNVSGIQSNVSNLADIDKMYDIVKDQKGHIDILFANAGIIEFASLGEISEKHFDKIFDIDVKGLLFTVQKAFPISGWKFNHFDGFCRFIQRIGRIKRLSCCQGSSTFVCSVLEP